MEINEQELIRRAKKGHQDALEQIFRYHLDSAIRLAYLITRNWATAEDAVQEAFLQAFRSLDSFQDERPFKPWFTKIVVKRRNVRRIVLIEDIYPMILRANLTEPLRLKNMLWAKG